MGLSSVIQSRFAAHLLFWLAFYALYIKLGLAIYPDWNAVAIIYIGKLTVQAIAAYILVYLLMPLFLNKKRYLAFALMLFFWTYMVYTLLVISRAVYLEPSFLSFFSNSERHTDIIKHSALSRLKDIDAYLDAVPWLFTPAAFMGLIKFYRTQLKLLKVAEEKKEVELRILKNQLNPHFLFNTLNNLYTLALKKDDRAPEIIAKLSEILDFALYRCNDNLIDIDSAVTLLENYIALENLRYGQNRLQVTFSRQYEQGYKLPPLILITLLENAFKHGVTNETGTAYINIELRTENNKVMFSIENSKPQTKEQGKSNTNGIGIKNITQQLDLLYGSSYKLTINDNSASFIINLVLDEH